MREDESVGDREEEGKDLIRQHPSLAPIRLQLPPSTPNPRERHHDSAPAITASPVLDDQAPRAIRDASQLGSVVGF